MKTWTKEEEQIIIKYVKKYPHNLSEAFILASNDTGRGIPAVRYRWYTKIKNSAHCFMTISPEKSIKNLKISKNPKPLEKGIWGKIKKLLKW